MNMPGKDLEEEVLFIEKSNASAILRASERINEADVYKTENSN
jgi:hypothetical protein